MGGYLTQQQLLEPAPRRRLEVKPDCRAWYGIDPSTARVAVAAVAVTAPDLPPRRWTRVQPFEAADTAQRLSAIYNGTRWLLEDLAMTWPLPGIAWVEQPSGKRVNPELSYAVGAIVAATYDALRYVTNHPVHVEMVPSSSWKKLATGYGAHFKPTRKELGRKPEFLDYAVARWARANGYAGSSWDEADAMGIAEAARREVLLDPR